jgi:NAD(P)-dependent dehydrogenase (short-subunit alcohol dehydrogenase family)
MAKDTAQTFAENGAKVYITGRRESVLEKSAEIHGSVERLGNSGGAIIPLQMDVTSKDSIKNAVAQIAEKEGFLNVYASYIFVPSANDLHLTRSSLMC